MRVSEDGRVLFFVDEDEIIIGVEKLKVIGIVMDIFELFFKLIKVYIFVEKIFFKIFEFFFEN